MPPPRPTPNRPADQDDFSTESLDAEITTLKTHLASLKRQLSLQTSTLLSSSILPSLLNSSEPPSKSAATSTSTTPIPEPGQLSEATKHSLQSRISAQKAHNTQSLYRTVAGITSFKVQDPDPRAVDGGRVLGIRIEAPSSNRPGKFVKAYYVLLNRPWGEQRSQQRREGGAEGESGQGDEEGGEELEVRKSYLQVHKHTVPPCIPLDALAARWLPPPPPSPSEDNKDDSANSNIRGQGRGRGRGRITQVHQNLTQFCRSLRREILRYHHRVSIVTDLKRLCGLLPSYQTQAQTSPSPSLSTPDPDTSTFLQDQENTILEADPIDQSSILSPNTQDEQTSHSRQRQLKRKRAAAATAKIISVSPADAEAKQIRIDWSDGRTGRIVLDDDGNVLKMVVYEDGVRDRETVRDVLLSAAGGGNGSRKKARIEEVVERLIGA